MLSNSMLLDDSSFNIAAVGDNQTSIDCQQLSSKVYAQLRQAAQRFMIRERHAHTMQATDLVHDAYLRLSEQQGAIRNEAHLIALASTMMRRVLINRALARRAEKRGSGAEHLTLGAADHVIFAAQDVADALHFERVLSKLAVMDPRMSAIVELRCLAGLTIAQTADELAISPATIKREWCMAKLWLSRELSRGD
jgi:RNA polymerase sigma-70 factor (ECF subfamily)